MNPHNVIFCYRITKYNPDYRDNNGIYSKNEWTNYSDIGKSLLFRDAIWCKLESDNMYVHFGWDFYVYIGTNNECNDAIKKTELSGLFVEPFASPYNDL